MDSPARLVGIELGGTKSIAVLALGERIVETITLPSSTPAHILPLLRAQIDTWNAEKRIDAIGIASFGPLQLNVRKPDFGAILSTPKPGWSGARVAETLTHALECPWEIDTDVNGAALAEHFWGAGAGCDALCYITIGTGVGGGLLIGGRPVHGAMHPEMGHLRLRRAEGDSFPGACPFHGDCVEGLICGPALSARLECEPAQAADHHPVWRHVASDIAELCGALLLTVSAQRILFGGSVALQRPFILEWVRAALVERLGAYLPFITQEGVRDIVRHAALGANAGPMGAIALAKRALLTHRHLT